jgi:hypothetical protein
MTHALAYMGLEPGTPIAAIRPDKIFRLFRKSSG